MTIEKIKIPDKDVPGWMQALRKSGFSDEEIDVVLSRLNVEYAKGRGIDVVEKELERIEKALLKTHGRALTKEQREYLRKSISDRPEFEDFKETK